MSFIWWLQFQNQIKRLLPDPVKPIFTKKNPVGTTLHANQKKKKSLNEALKVCFFKTIYLHLFCYTFEAFINFIFSIETIFIFDI